MDRSRTSACTAIRSDMIWKSTTLSSSRYFDKTNPTPLTCSDRIKNSANYIRSFVCFSRSLDFIGKLTKPLVFPSSETNFASWSPFPPQLANRHFRWPIQHQDRRWQTLARSEKISSDAASFRAGNCQFRFGDNVFPSALARPAGSWHSRGEDARESADVGSEHLRRGKVLDSLSQRNVHRYGKTQMSSKYLCEYLQRSLPQIHHARSLPITTGGQEPNTYVKTYLIPDRSKITKRKTKVIKKSCFPSFMETLEYRMPIQAIKMKTLQITVWEHDTLQENEFLGGVQLPLVDLNLKEEISGWYRLGYLPRS